MAGGSRTALFESAGDVVADGSVARLGRLTLADKTPIQTPNYFATTSRGVVPHLTPDNLAKYAQYGGVYVALEDFIERFMQAPGRMPAIFKTPPGTSRPINSFTGMPSSIATVLGPRRSPAVAAPMGNGHNFISIFTSTGFRPLRNTEYAEAVEALKPDIVIPMADLPFSDSTPSSKRRMRMADRTDEWIDVFFRALDYEGTLEPAAISVFAPLLPVEYSMQWEYLDRLSGDLSGGISGLAVYDSSIVPDLQNYKTLLPLPRLSLDHPDSPHQILRQMSLGIDLFLLPFINQASDAGVALTFSFAPPPPPPGHHPTGLAQTLLPLGIDMSAVEHQASVAPLSAACGCYACTRHHRAFVQHLLNAREMLGWTLLQLHNHEVVSDFFAGARAALAGGRERFDGCCARFARAYEPELPRGLGERPRARGYHFKTEGGDAKRNKPGWGNLGRNSEPAAPAHAQVEGAQRAATAAMSRDAAETPLVPDIDGAQLDQKGFAELEK